MEPDLLTDARDVVVGHFPTARWALLAGSVTTADRTPGSDLDIVVLLPDDDPQAPHRRSLIFRDWPVELFVHDESTLAHYIAKDLSQRGPALCRMVATGIPLLGEPHGWQARCAATLAAGPLPLTGPERDYARYGLTDLLDDLAHTASAGERLVIADAAWTAAAQRVLALAGHWNGNGKWLLRELRDFDPDLAERWLAAHGDPEAIAVFVRLVLDRNGGPLFAGYHASGERPAPPPG